MWLEEMIWIWAPLGLVASAWIIWRIFRITRALRELRDRVAQLEETTEPASGQRAA